MGTSDTCLPDGDHRGFRGVVAISAVPKDLDGFRDEGGRPGRTPLSTSFHTGFGTYLGFLPAAVRRRRVVTDLLCSMQRAFTTALETDWPGAGVVIRAEEAEGVVRAWYAHPDGRSVGHVALPASSLTMPPAGDRIDAATSPSLTRRAAYAAVNAVSFGLADVVSSPRHRWLVRTVLHGSTVCSSVPAMRRAAPQLRQSWQRMRAASTPTRRIALGISLSVVITVSVIAFGWYRLLVRSANVLAARGVRYPRLVVGIASESFAFAVSARARRTRLTGAHHSAVKTRPSPDDDQGRDQ